MPITNKEFERGKKTDPTEEAILTFLKTHRDSAFSANEVLEGIGVPTGQGIWDDLSKFFAVNTYLDALVQERKVRKKLVSGQWYYTIYEGPV